LGLLSPDDPENAKVALRYQIEEEIDDLDLEEVLDLILEHKKNISSFSAMSFIGSEEEIDFILTNFNFTQQVIFDYYEFKESE